MAVAYHFAVRTVRDAHAADGQSDPQQHQRTSQEPQSRVHHREGNLNLNEY